ncbi:unnamed protein product [Rodentolepis nana]|uniref:Uncharacterized protein n=1 Tax=Rodentolepis nana TaxID=102285 RepID=A0A0R3TA42_RODNA|nr:unnamed protein product [Rodentolepis nana]
MLWANRLGSGRLPDGLAVRIPGSHPGGPGSTPGQGVCFGSITLCHCALTRSHLIGALRGGFLVFTQVAGFNSRSGSGVLVHPGGDAKQESDGLLGGRRSKVRKIGPAIPLRTCARTGTRTLDPQIKSLMLYRLSYPGSRREQLSK